MANVVVREADVGRHQRKESDIFLPLLVDTDALGLTALFDYEYGYGHKQ